MTFPACLRKVLHERVQVQRRPDGSFLLRERGVMKVEVSELAGDAVVTRLNQIGELSRLKDGPWKQVCDYVVIRQSRATIQVLFVELKLNLTEEVKGLEQLRRSLRFIRYLSAICHVECGVEQCVPEVRYALVAARQSPRLAKQRVRVDGAPTRKVHAGIEVGIHVVGKRVAWGRLWDG